MSNYNRNYNRNNDNDDYYEEDNFGYSQEELDDMYRGAFEGDPDAYWNIDFPQISLIYHLTRLSRI